MRTAHGGSYRDFDFDNDAAKYATVAWKAAPGSALTDRNFSIRLTLAADRNPPKRRDQDRPAGIEHGR